MITVKKKKEMRSINFGGSAKARVVGDEINVYGDEKRIKWLNRIYNPAFRINFCPICGRRISDEKNL